MNSNIPKLIFVFCQDSIVGIVTMSKTGRPKSSSLIPCRFFFL